MSRTIVLLILVAVLWPVSFASPTTGRRQMIEGESRPLNTPLRCRRSRLEGFEHYADLSGNGILLHWRVSFPEIFFALQARPSSEANGGWLAIGFSKLGYMGASDAIIANLLPQYGGIRTFELQGYKKSDVVETNRFSVGDASVMSESDGALLVKFTRRHLEGSQAPINVTGENNILFAFFATESNTIDYHGENKGGASIDFACRSQDMAYGASSSPLADLPSSVAMGGERDVRQMQENDTPASSALFSDLPHTVALGGERYLRVDMHWRVDGTDITVAADMATTGWLALGWSLSGAMIVSEAVIGNHLPTPTTSNGQDASFFLINGYSLSAIRMNSRVALSNVSVTTIGGRTIMRFTRSLLGGIVSLVKDEGASVEVIWAYSPSGSKTLAYHGRSRGSLTVNLELPESTLTLLAAAGVSSEESTSPTTLGGDSVDEEQGSTSAEHDHDHDSLYAIFVLHGIFLTLAFAALMPSAIIVARLFLADRPSAAESEPLAGRDALQEEASDSRPSLDEDPEQSSDDVAREISEKDLVRAGMRAKALRVHLYLQVTAVGLCLVGVLLLLAVEGTDGMDWAHGKLGFIVASAAALQVLLGFVRPERSSPARGLWLSAHWCLGVGTVVGGCANVFLGLNLFGFLFEAKTVVPICILVLVIATWLVPYSLLVIKDLQARRRDKGSSASNDDSATEDRAGDRLAGGGSNTERGGEMECAVLTRSDDEQ